MNKKKILLILLILLGFSAYLIAQNADEELASYQKKYPGENAVCLTSSRETEISLKNGQITIVEHIHEERLLLNDNFNLYTQERVNYSSFSKLSDLTAYTLVPDGHRYHKVSASDFRDVKSFGSSVFYDDQGEKAFVFPAVKQGAKLVIDYTLTLLEPHFFGYHVFCDNIPVEKSEFIVHAPADMKLSWKYYGINTSGIKHLEEKGRKTSTLIWSMENIEKYIHEEDVPYLKNVTQVVLWIESYQNEGKRINFLASNDDLYRWYVKLLKNVDYSLDKSILFTVDSLTQNCRTETDKVRAIYYWNQDNIKYIAFEEGYEGYVPRKPVDVFSKRYGDCKDKALLLCKMLAAAGIKSYMTWIGTNNIPYLFTEQPSPLNCNHVIVTWFNEAEKPLFLDATASHLQLGLPNEFIQGKEALVGLSDTSWKILKVPEVLSEANRYRDSIVVRVEGSTLKGQGHYNCEGYIRARVINQLQDLDYEKTKRFCNNYLSKGNNKCKLDTAVIERPFDRDKDLVIDYRLSIPDYLQTDKDEIFINLNLDKPFTNSAIKLQQKKYSLEHNYQIHAMNIVVLEIPDGYEVEHIPQDMSKDSEILNFSANYVQTGRKVIYTQNIKLNFVILEPNKFNAFNDLIRQLNQAYVQTIILKKI